MEFLDDLIKKQDDEAQPEPENAPENTSWDDLLKTIDLEDSQEIDAPGKKSRQKNEKDSTGKERTPRRGKGVLIFLGISVFLVCGILIALALRFTVNNASFLPLTPVDTNPIAPTTQEPDTEPLPTQNTEEATPEPLPTEVISPDEETAASPEPAPGKPQIEDAPFTRFDREIEENPDFADLYLVRGQEYIDKKAYEAALADFEYALSLDENRGEPYAGMGKSYFYLRRWSEAESAFISAVERNPELSEAHFWLGHIYFYKGEYKAAAAAFDMAAEIDRSDARAEAWLAFASAELGDFEETQGAVSRAISLTQDIAVVYIARSELKLMQDPPDIDGAQGDLLYARDLEPNGFVSLNALANFYLEYRPERLAEAELLAHYAYNWAQTEIEQAIALQTLGRVYLARDLKAEAEKTFIEAMDLATVDGIVILVGLPDDFMRSRD